MAGSTHVTELLWDHAGSALTPEQSALVREHLAGCAECTQTLSAMTAARAAAQQSREAPAPSVDWKKVTEGINARVRTPRRSLAWAWSFAAAAVLVLVVMVGRGGSAPVTVVEQSIGSNVDSS